MNSYEFFLKPFFYMFDPTKRLFFIYLLSSFVLAFLAVIVQKKNFGKSLEEVLNKKVWTHVSTKIDISLLMVNTLLRSLLFLFIVVSAMSVARGVMHHLYDWFPQSQPWSFSYRQLILIYSVSSFLALDFSRFFQHYLFHKLPFLWKFHKIHHSAEVLTPLTLYRTHPVESVLSSFRRLFVTGVVSGVFMFKSQSMIDAYAIFGVNAIDFVFNFLGSNLRHSHVWLSFGPMNHIFISPAQHQIHHSRNIKHHDKNLGFSLSIWDKLFGTFYQVRKKEFLIFGVRGERYKNLWQSIKAPFDQPQDSYEKVSQSAEELTLKPQVNLSR